MEVKFAVAGPPQSSLGCWSIPGKRYLTLLLRWVMRGAVMLPAVFFRVVLPVVMSGGVLRRWIARSLVCRPLARGGNSRQAKSRDGHCKNALHWILHWVNPLQGEFNHKVEVLSGERKGNWGVFRNS